MKKYLLLSLFTVLIFSFSEPTYKIAILKYNGGGDWYANPTSLKNLINFCNNEINTNIKNEYATVDVGSSDIFNYPFIHMTGHGNVIFSDQEAKNLRLYLESGGFLHIDDNYGMDKYIRVEMKKVFPEIDWLELPSNHSIYNQKFKFKNGLPKIHEHDGKNSQGLALIKDGRMVCFYTYECDLSDGWEDQSIHNNSNTTRLKALKMGANIIQYVFLGKKI
tara:strand:+ start:3073 stop:3732 length:660 start_codon:yes stop_codon:yes gene_type:complete